jgi:chromosome segregation ATPase
MEKHLASGSFQAWPTPRALQYTQTQVGEAFESLERDLRTTILAEAGKNYHDFLAEYKRQMNKASSTAFKPWEDLIKKWQDKLKEVDSSLSQLDVFKNIIREQAYEAFSDESRKIYDTLDAKFTTLEAGKQELHQVVADSITTYVSDLQDSLTRSTQALQQSTQALQQSTQALASTQKHLDTAVQELQRLQTISGRNSSDSIYSPAEERIDNNINANESHSNSHPPSTNNIALPMALTNTTSIDD